MKQLKFDVFSNTINTGWVESAHKRPQSRLYFFIDCRYHNSRVAVNFLTFCRCKVLAWDNKLHIWRCKHKLSATTLLSVANSLGQQKQLCNNKTAPQFLQQQNWQPQKRPVPIAAGLESVHLQLQIMLAAKMGHSFGMASVFLSPHWICNDNKKVTSNLFLQWKNIVTDLSNCGSQCQFLPLRAIKAVEVL